MAPCVADPVRELPDSLRPAPPGIPSRCLSGDRELRRLSAINERPPRYLAAGSMSEEGRGSRAFAGSIGPARSTRAAWSTAMGGSSRASLPARRARDPALCVRLLALDVALEPKRTRPLSALIGYSRHELPSGCSLGAFTGDAKNRLVAGGFPMARPKLEPGTPRFQSCVFASEGIAICRDLWRSQSVGWRPSFSGLCARFPRDTADGGSVGLFVAVAPD